MNYFNAIILSGAILLLSGACFGQSNSTSHDIGVNIPEVALLGLISEQAETVEIVAQSPTTAGSSIDLSQNTHTTKVWINYSSVSRSHDHQRKIVAMVQGEIPKGIRLLVEASKPAGRGVGQLGVPAGRVALSTMPTEIITNIGSSYTGSGPKSGHALTYKVEMEDNAASYAQLTGQPTSLNVIYTLTDIN